MTKNRTIESLKNPEVGMENATRANPSEIRNCIVTTQNRLVRVMSTNGLHSGFTTHGKFSKLVYSARSVFEIPIRLYMVTDITMTIT